MVPVPRSFMRMTIMFGMYPLGSGGFTAERGEVQTVVNSPLIRVDTRAISFPAQSLIPTGKFGGENFSPKPAARTDRIPR